MGQMKCEEPIVLDMHIGPLQDASVGWMWAGYCTIQNKNLVMKAFELCTVQRLRNLKQTDPDLYHELTDPSKDSRPSDEEVIVEDDMTFDGHGLDRPDDTVIQTADVIADVLKEEPSCPILRQTDGVGLMLGADAESTTLDANEPVAEDEKKSEDKPKRNRRPNTLYAGGDWWRHANDKDEDLALGGEELGEGLKPEAGRKGKSRQPRKKGN
ncbi:hypothetical protein AAF712_015651 [Marasmius tenuissimus]|uniref:Uncharacterized protein n=1 Tax=Marasmius tenuissimus TaxID=585030 RepID=A0ABR2Z8T2_9AGAR